MCKTFDTIMRLMIESARESDYLVTTVTKPLLAPYSVIAAEMRLVGSSKKDITKIVIDYDSVYTGEPVAMHLTPKIMDTDQTDDQCHYWGVIGGLFKIISDISPACITSYLIDKNMNAELAIFKQYTIVSLPFS
jgi:hypothetical protein